MKIQKRHIVLASLMFALATAVFINWRFSPESSSKLKDVSKELGVATYVNAETSTDDQVENVSKQVSQSDAYFAKASLERDQSRDEAIDIAQKTLTLSDSSEEAKTKAVEQLSKLEDNIVIESNVENLLKAKGFSNCLCMMSEDSCSVAVIKKEMTENAPLIIKDAVLSQCEIDFNSISIVEV